MAAIDITFAELFGTNSRFRRVDADILSATQNFTFPGFPTGNNVFTIGLGGEGELWVFQGLLRSTARSAIETAAADIRAILDGDGLTAISKTSGIKTFNRQQTVLNVGANDTSNAAKMYFGMTTPTGANMTVAKIETGEWERASTGSNIVVVVPFRCALRRLI